MNFKNDINDLAPTRGERIICDFFGNGHYHDCILADFTKTTFKAVWNEGAARHVVRVDFHRRKSENCFWRGAMAVLHYQYTRGEK